MTPDESRQRASEGFDERDLGDAVGLPGDAGDLAAWSLIARHLEGNETVLLPADFRDGVRRAVARAKLRRDLLLISLAALVTGLLLTFVIALALGLHWWPRAFAAVQPGAVLAGARSFLEQVAAGLNILLTFLKGGKALWSLLPAALLAIAIVAALAELAAFRLLRVGPFLPEPARHPRNFIL
jgi:hypothetical protein